MAPSVAAPETALRSFASLRLVGARSRASAAPLAHPWARRSVLATRSVHATRPSTFQPRAGSLAPQASPSGGASAVVRAVGELFGADRGSDCDIVFSLEDTGKDPSPDEQPQLRTRAAAPAGAAVVSAPLPGHSLILSLASELFHAQVETWADGASPAAETSSSPASRRLQLHVPLNSAAEAPFARAAIGFAYTGQVAAAGVREALEVRRQAGYLQISGCAAACDELLLGMLAAGKAKLKVQVAQPPSPVAAELTECWGLMPNPADDPSFAPVLAAAKRALVRHFGDALAALNTPSLLQQLLQLPAAAVEVLLGSYAFGTDTEDTVLLLLATWMKVNHSATDAATRARLCRQVRLVQLSRPYLTTMLLALAADYEAGAGGSPCAWFPISIAEAGFIIALATDEEGVGAFLWAGRELYDTQSPWYSTSPRPQYLSEEGRAFEWAISEEKLQEALGRLKAEGGVEAYGSFAGGDRLCARGFAWKVKCQVQHAATSAGCYLECAMPAAYDVPGSRLGRGSNVAAPAVGLEARLAVRRWDGGARQDARILSFAAQSAVFSAGARPQVRRGWGNPSALPLAQPQPAGGVEVLAGWAACLHDGRLTGTMTLLPHR